MESKALDFESEFPLLNFPPEACFIKKSWDDPTLRGGGRRVVSCGHSGTCRLWNSWNLHVQVIEQFSSKKIFTDCAYEANLLELGI